MPETYPLEEAKSDELIENLRNAEEANGARITQAIREIQGLRRSQAGLFEKYGRSIERIEELEAELKALRGKL